MALSLTKPVMNGAGHRQCPSWIESFVAHTEDRESPEIWRRWTAVGVISSALERKVWVRTKKGDLLVNHYIILVGYPATGKSDTIKVGRRMLRILEEDKKLHIAPKDTSCAALVDFLNKSKRVILRPGQTPPTIEYNACVSMPDEFTTFLAKYDNQFVAFLTDIYEGERYDQHRRGLKEDISLLSPTLNLLAATTPSNLVKFMPEGAWDQGFASRVLLIYNGDKSLGDIFGDEGEDGLDDGLVHDLRIIAGLYGNMEISEEAKDAFRSWRAAGLPPQPSHPKLIHYAGRRTAHALRLAAILSVSRSNDLRMSLEDFEEARRMLIEAESVMPEIFFAGKTGAQTEAMDEAYNYLHAMTKGGKQLPAYKMVHFFRERVPAPYVIKVIEIMIAEGSMKEHLDAKTGQKSYTLGVRQPRFD